LKLRSTLSVHKVVNRSFGKQVKTAHSPAPLSAAGSPAGHSCNRLPIMEDVEQMCANRHGFRLKSSRTANSYRLFLVTAILCFSGLLSCQNESQHHSVTLTWQASPSTAQVHVLGYNVYRRTIAGTAYVRIAARVPRAAYEDRIVNSRTTYLYAVTAVDQHCRESSFSNVVRVEVP